MSVRRYQVNGTVMTKEIFVENIDMNPSFKILMNSFSMGGHLEVEGVNFICWRFGPTTAPMMIKLLEAGFYTRNDKDWMIH